MDHDADLVTLNPETDVERVWSVRHYQHPLFDRGSRQAQTRFDAINGARGIYYSGAYWGWGFHEDGFMSGRRVAASVQEARSRAA